MKNRRPDLNGIIVVNKPLGWTSADVCRYVRKGTGGAKTGHAGTLDPMATGVLILCLGRATKLIDSLMAGRKRYLATIDLAHTSPTDDLEGGKTAVEVAIPPTADAVRAACAPFVGQIMQTPPAHSAIWIDGERAYKMARRGEAPEMKSRPVEIDSINVVSYDWPLAVLDVRCGKGTYIRSLARDLGKALGVGGMLVGLERTEVGPYRVEDARSMEEVAKGVTQADLHEGIQVMEPRP